MTDLINKVDRFLIKEDGFMEKLSKSLEAQRLHDLRNNFSDYMRDVGKSGDLLSLLLMEYKIVEKDLNRHSNSKAMTESLETALVELDIVKDHIELVSDPIQYQVINRDHKSPKYRKNGLPYDGARKAMASHYTRLGNLDKSRLTSAEKSIIDVRRENIKVMQKLYEKMQAKAIGIDLSHGNKSKNTNE
ncbi:hypothetical protein [Bartonella bilalgolemii]|uniref:Phage related protein n=1 Tax=Bartonella bilalgolemii TaxID=2942911 RepID=A0ABT0PA47_9HYPH|nr:hypothetical protein [Bartonella sp. G70]MCL6230276.1 hypothetical protein [Bartonella sp. G70]